MARNSMTNQALRSEGYEALEMFRWEEQRLRETLVEISEYNPEATIEDAKEVLRDRDAYCGAEEFDGYEPKINFGSSMSGAWDQDW